MIDERIDDILKELKTPKDWNTINPKDRANILVLSFIGYVARPKNIPKETLEIAIEAFNNNRGKVEKEVEAVEQAFKERGL